MIPVKQTKFTSKDGMIHGNCMAACLASLFEVNIKDVPALGDMPVGEWHIPFYEFLNKHGYDSLGVEEDIKEMNNYNGVDGFFMVAGKSPRSYVENGHAVIYKNGKIIHDPHPSNDGIGEFRYFYIIEKIK